MGKQIWHPDTCGCVIEEDNTGGTVTFSKAIAKCAAHAAVADQDLYSTVLDGENRKKNKIHNFLVNAGISGLTEVDADSGSLVLKKGILLNWSWTGSGPNRVITIWLTGFALTAQQKTAAQNWCNSQFGAGKVVVA